MCVRFVVAAFAVIAVWFAMGPTQAATITKSSSINCVLAIEGDIRAGDFEKFLEMEKLFPPHDGESSSNARVCLNSRGGSLTEGVRFAAHFYKNGIGTVVDAGQGCYSSCAIMFMMGVATGDEVSFVNRRLHIHGSLGFHRPYINIKSEGPAEPETLSAAYDNALKSALDLIALANSKAPWSREPVLKPDLLQAMLQHVGRDMFEIDTVDKAGRWDVELFGHRDPALLTEEQAYYACQNSLTWPSSLTTDDITFNDQLRGGVKRVDTPDATPAFQVEGYNNGYVYAGCIISSRGGALYGCGIDETTSVILGSGNCDETNFTDRSHTLNLISVHNPTTAKSSLGDLIASKSARCAVLKGPETIDDEPCDVEEIALAGAGLPDAKAVTHYKWPSGGRTVVVHYEGRIEINGVRTEETRRPGLGLCYHNSNTGNLFCVQR